MSKFTQLRAFSALESRNFRRYFFGQCCSLSGTWMQRVALGWLVKELTESGGKMGLVEFLNQCPVFFVGLFIGIYLDRSDLRKVLIGTQSFMIVHSLLMALLVYSGAITYEIVLVFSFLLGIISAVDMPARQASISQMIEHPSQLQSALSLQSTTFNLARLVGQSLAGLAIMAGGTISCFLINGIAPLAVLYAYITMHLPERKRSSRSQKVADAFVEGIRYMWTVTPIRLCILFNYMFSFVAVPFMVLLPLVASRTLEGNASHYGFMMGGVGFGALFGAMFIAFRVMPGKLPGHIWKMQTMFGVILIIFSQITDWRLAVAVVPLLGFSLISSFVSNNSLIQALVDEDKRARVLSYYSFGLLGFGPLGAFIAGKLTDHLENVSVALLVCAICCLVIGILHGLRQKAYDATVPEILRGKGLS